MTIQTSTNQSPHIIFNRRTPWGLRPIAAVIFIANCLTLSGSCGTIPSDSKEVILPVVAPFEMPQLKRPDIPQRQFNIRDFGAEEGGLVKNTGAIRKAIEAASKVGGGVVVSPEGKWLTGAINLDNNIDLHLAKGAELLFSQDFGDYLPVVFSRHEDIECFKHSAFIYADGKANIAITGEGTLNGQGNPWWGFKESKKDVEKRLYDMGANGVPVAERVFDGSDGNILRPAFFQPMRCRNILVEGVTFLYGAFWTITPTYCENVIVRRVRIVTEGSYGHTPNGDGVDPSSSKNVLIEYCDFDTGDDCIAIKAGRDNDGLRVGMPTENIVIRHCVGLRGHGGIVIGSETSGNIRNVYAYDCKFTGTDRIVRIKTARGRGGIVENMWFRDMHGDKIEMEAIHINMLYTGKRFPAQPVTESTPRIRNINFTGIYCTMGKSYAIEMLGLPEMSIENVTIDSVDMNAVKGIACTDVKGVKISNAKVITQELPLIKITDGENIALESILRAQNMAQLLLVSGEKSREIKIRRSGLVKNDKSVSVGTEVPRGAVLIEE